MEQILAETSNASHQPVNAAAVQEGRSAEPKRLFVALRTFLKQIKQWQVDAIVARQSGRGWCDATEREITGHITGGSGIR